MYNYFNNKHSTLYIYIVSLNLSMAVSDVRQCLVLRLGKMASFLPSKYGITKYSELEESQEDH